ncbi:4-hydroxy-3-methylbut-2-en-1-yl diphosphate synthase, partial [bacterium]|nr:4-hydroxy-3-methylbut-2-en-1-yl diphosphate synthase [bacterium]
IHFRSDMALAALDAGTDKLRINPGNISNPQLLQKIARQAVEKNLPIRVGVNAGSLAKDLLDRYGDHSAEALAMSAERSVKLLEDENVRDILVSMKANDARWTIDAYRIFAQKNDYPLHLGVTEAGAGRAAVVNSWAGIGALLQQGIGDTIRISLTEDPRLEVIVGHLLLHYLNLPRVIY